MKKNLVGLVLTASVCGMVPAVFGAATYDGTSVPGVLTVNVDAEGATLDAAMVTENVTNIVKVGAGPLTATPLQTYMGDFTIDEGEFVVALRYDLGMDDVGTVYVNDGASLVDASVFLKSDGKYDWGASLSKKKTFVFSGAPAAGTVGKFYRTVENGTAWFGNTSTFRFLSDATVNFRRQRIKWRGVIDLGGHTLSLDSGNSWVQIQVDCMVTNGGSIVVQGNRQHTPGGATLQCEGGTFGFYPSETPRSLTLTNANYDVRATCAANGATLNLIDAYIGTPNRHALKTKTDAYRWDGPVNAMGNSRIAYGTGYTNVFNVAGDIGGSGTLTIGPGWLNLSKTPASAFAGDVVVKADTTGKIASEHSGVALLDNSPFFPAARSITFQDGANLSLCTSYDQTLPGLSFSGVGTATVTGGRPPIADVPRVALAGISKTDDGTLYLETPVCVTGTASIAGGTLKLPPKLYGHAGLWEWTCADMSKGEYESGQNCWCSGDGDFSKGYMKTNQVDAVYSRRGPEKAFTGYKSIVSNGHTRATGVIYKGYLWNRSSEPVTWQFAIHQTYRGQMWLAGVWGPSAYQGESENGTNVFTRTLQPGPNAVVIYLLSASWKGEQKPSPRFDGLGLSYDPNPVAGQTNVANFVKLDDGGSGRLFTLDTADGPEAAADLLPAFDDLTFALGAVFDLNGNTFPQGNLTGFPRVENGDLMITNSWSLSTAEVLTGQKLVATGKLSFADGAKITSADPFVSNTQKIPEIVIAEAASVTGKPVVDADAPALREWRVETTATTVKLVYTPQGSVILFR